MSTENGALRRKVIQLKRAKNEAQRQLSIILEKNKIDTLLKSYCMTRDSSVQTEVRPWTRGASLLPRTETKPSQAELEKTNRMITMHAQLLKRYEKEVKQNVTNTETISELTVQVATLERRLCEEQEKPNLLEKQLAAVKGKASTKTKHGPAQVDDPVLREVMEERDKLSGENKRLRQELKGLDKGFFDEIEDLKFALQQSAKLNREYEKTLKHQCVQFGVPFPHPERVLDVP